MGLQKLLGHAKLEDTVKYLHLSRRHLQSVVNPLDSLTVNRTAQEMERSAHAGEQRAHRGHTARTACAGCDQGAD